MTVISEKQNYSDSTTHLPALQSPPSIKTATDKTMNFVPPTPTNNILLSTDQTLSLISTISTTTNKLPINNEVNNKVQTNIGKTLSKPIKLSSLHEK